MNIKAGIQRRLRKFTKKVNHAFRVATSRWRKLPDFIIIGTQKGGTTSLFACLKQHPEVAMSRQKEAHFFNTHFEKGLIWYKRFFPFKNSKKIAGEVTPCYMYHPQAAERMKAILPNVKLIVMLRNPIDRAYSGYIMGREFGWDDTETFEAALEQEEHYKILKIKTLQDNPKYYSEAQDRLFYLERSKYYSQLKLWFKYFKREQFLFIKSENFFKNPKNELTKVYDFLSITRLYPEDLKPRNARNYDAILPETATQLDSYFKKENEQLIELLGEEFSWE